MAKAAEGKSHVQERFPVECQEVLLLNPCELGCQETIGEPPKV